MRHHSNFIHDNLGVLCVFLDDPLSPLFCLPIDLTSLLDLDSGQALVGFTASTGQQWQTHDILQWRFCEQIDSPFSPCPYP